MSADYFPSFFLSDPVPSSSAEVNFDTNSFLCDPKPHFTQNIDSSSASVGSGDFSYLAPSSPSDCSLNSFDESNSSAASVPRDDSMNSSISLYEPSHFASASLFASPRVGPSTHSLLLSPQPAQPTAAAVKTKLEVLSPRLTPAVMPVAALPTATANVASAAAMPLSALPPSIFNMVLPLPMSGASASFVASPATSTTALSPSPRSISGSGSANGPVDTDTVRELLKEQGVKKQRLARKAELARMSRKRKKTRLCDLEVEVAQLKDELEKERKARKVAENCLAIAQQQARMTATPAPAQPEADQSIAAENALAEESKSLHDQLRRQLSADSKEVPRLVSEVLNVVKRRQTHTAQQIRGLSRHMTPSLQLRFIEWALAQKDAFYADNSGLWNSLFVREVGLSQEQLATLMNFRAAMQQQRAVAQEMQTAFAKFSAAFEQHNNLANESLAKFVSVFTPEQLGKFFNWVDTYGQVCVQINI